MSECEYEKHQKEDCKYCAKVNSLESELATERDRFGKKETELMQELAESNHVVETCCQGWRKELEAARKVIEAAKKLDKEIEESDQLTWPTCVEFRASIAAYDGVKGERE